MKHVAMVVFVAALALPAQATAVKVHKCRTVAGNVLYQSSPCAPGERTLAAWEAPADPPIPAAAKRRATEALSRPERRGRSRGSYRSRQVAVASAIDGCAAAKARRDEIERRVGLARTYELLSALNREVYDACK